MTIDSATFSIWMGDEAINRQLERPPLPADISVTDILIVGAGITGLTCAYALAGQGRGVVVIDDGRVGGGTTARTTAHLSCAIDDWIHVLAQQRGQEIAAIGVESHRAAIDYIEEVVTREQIACDFKRLDGYLVLGEGCDDSDLDAELAAAQKAGLTDVESLSPPPAGIPGGRSLRFSAQARINPLEYIAGLAQAVERHGGKIFSGAHVIEVSDGSPVTVTMAAGRSLSASEVIVATASPVNDRLRMHTKLAPYRTYAIAAQSPLNVIPDALIWDTEDPYHYVRLATINGKSYAVIGGSDHKTGQSDDEEKQLSELADWARAHFHIGDVEYAWSGQVMETLDGLGYIGVNPGDRHVYVACGDSGMGMTHGTIAGILIPDLIRDGRHRWAHAYDPSRKPLGAAVNFIRENANVAAQYMDFIKRPKVKRFDDIQPGEGAVLQHGTSKIAAFRDDMGKLHVRSALCPHLGCVVRWNTLEKMWDCPCHGSQFDPTGRALHGPSVRSLSTVADFNEEKNPNITEQGSLNLPS